MKLYDVITGHNYCITGSMYGHSNCDITREGENYQSIALIRKLTISDLKKTEDEIYICAYEAIQQNDEFYENIETIEEYSAVTEDGEEVRIFVPDLW